MNGPDYPSRISDHDHAWGHVLGDDGARSDYGLSPMVTAGQLTAMPPIQTLSPMVIGRAASHVSRRVSGSRG